MPNENKNSRMEACPSRHVRCNNDNAETPIANEKGPEIKSRCNSESSPLWIAESVATGYNFSRGRVFISFSIINITVNVYDRVNKPRKKKAIPNACTSQKNIGDVFLKRVSIRFYGWASIISNPCRAARDSGASPIIWARCNTAM